MDSVSLRPFCFRTKLLSWQGGRQSPGGCCSQNLSSGLYKGKFENLKLYAQTNKREDFYLSLRSSIFVNVISKHNSRHVQWLQRQPLRLLQSQATCQDHRALEELLQLFHFQGIQGLESTTSGVYACFGKPIIFGESCFICFKSKIFIIKLFFPAFHLWRAGVQITIENPLRRHLVG